MGNAVDKCVHCGLCLATCPTYILLGEEMDSPRGRIFLMKEALEGSLTPEEVTPYIDRCLGCMACTTACPSGVEYGDLLAPFRAKAEQYRRRPVMGSVTRRLVRETLPYPDRFRAAFRASQLAGPARRLAPAALAPMMALLPDELPASEPLPPIIPAQGPRRARVALLTGCVQQALAPDINWATIRVLARNGVEIVIPQGQGCCGSLSLHIGEQDQARELARRNLKAFPRDVDAVITNAAGCGSGIHEYPLLFAGQDDAEAAAQYAESSDGHHCVPGPVWPCAAAGCGRAGPRRLSRRLPPGARAGRHPGTAAGCFLPSPVSTCSRFRKAICVAARRAHTTSNNRNWRVNSAQRKIHNARTVQPDMIATGNIGCMIQMRNHANGADPLPVVHTIIVLDRAYAGVSLRTGTDERA